MHFVQTVILFFHFKLTIELCSRRFRCIVFDFHKLTVKTKIEFTYASIGIYFLINDCKKNSKYRGFCKYSRLYEFVVWCSIWTLFFKFLHVLERWKYHFNGTSPYDFLVYYPLYAKRIYFAKPKMFAWYLHLINLRVT